MAQQAVFTVLERGGSIAVDEAKYLLGVSEKLDSAKKQLEGIRAFLKDMDERMMKGSAMAKNLVSNVREVAYEVENIIDTANILTRQTDPKTSIKGAICKHACFPIYLTHLHNLGARIDAANAMMKTIFEESKRHNIAATAIAEPYDDMTQDDTIKHWRSVHPDFEEEVDVIGFDEQIKQINDVLLDERSKHLSVLSIVGPGGAGKSTMAKKVYSSAVTRGHFKVHAWITVSQKVVPHNLLTEMVKRLVPSHQLEDMIRRVIKEEEAKEVKEVTDLERLVPPHLLEEIPRHLLEEVLMHMLEDEKANKAKKNTLIPRHLFEEMIKHNIADWKAKGAKEEGKEEVKDLLEELIKRTKEDEEAREAEEARKAKNIEDLDKLSEEQLTKLLHKFGLRERYLIVLDDIWSTDVWDIIQAAFPDKKNGSIVILTTRNEAIALHPQARKKIYKPKLLNEEESTKLLLKIALPEHVLDVDSDSSADMGQNMDEMKKLGKDLAMRCYGLPLAIIVLGGYLSRNLDVAEWKRLTSNMDWHVLIKDNRIIGTILDLSYYDMPSHLRSCFMYTTAFPENSTIDIRVLARLWVAEGFIPLVRGHTREQVAVKYVAELVQRCMIQVERRTMSGRIKEVKVHDILRGWGIERARREGVIKDYHDEEDIEAAYSEEMLKAYRVVLHGSLEREVGTSMRKLRTLLDFTLSFKNPKVQVAKSFQVLRVLYLHCSGKVSLPREIGQMKYLRYLGLGGNCLYHLPSSVGDLLSLETVYATASIHHIPGSLWDIPTLGLMHILDARSWSVPRISLDSKMHVMVFSTRGKTDVPTSSTRTTIIRDAKRIMEATQQQVSRNKNPNLSCCFGMRYDRHDLEIVGRCKRGLQVPDDVPNFEEMHDIALLKICCANLLSSDQIMLELGRMKLLKMLEIGDNSYTGLVMTCPSGSFPCLERLVFHDLAVKDWKIEHGSLKSLRRLTLCMCPNLSYLPRGLTWLPDLVKVDLIAMSPGYHQDTVVQALKEKGCVVSVSSDEKKFQHLQVP
ncbi:hypothetical protein EJB05_46592, partial [Eragrostis curvula]